MDYVKLEQYLSHYLMVNEKSRHYGRVNFDKMHTKQNVDRSTLDMIICIAM